QPRCDNGPKRNIENFGTLGFLRHLWMQLWHAVGAGGLIARHGWNIALGHLRPIFVLRLWALRAIFRAADWLLIPLLMLIKFIAGEAYPIIGAFSALIVVHDKPFVGGVFFYPSESRGLD